MKTFTIIDELTQARLTFSCVYLYGCRKAITVMQGNVPMYTRKNTQEVSEGYNREHKLTWGHGNTEDFIPS